MPSEWSRVTAAANFLKACEQAGFTPADIDSLTSGKDNKLLPGFVGVFRGTHEIVRPSQVINTHLLLPTDTFIDLPAISNQLTKSALVTTSDDETSPFRYRTFYISLPKSEERTKKARFRSYRPGEYMTFARMVENVGGLMAVKERHLATQWQIRRAVDAQVNGEEGPLRTNGYANFFFVSAPETKEGVAVVHVYWDSGSCCWHVWVHSLSYSLKWLRAYRLFLRTEDLGA